MPSRKRSRKKNAHALACTSFDIQCIRKMPNWSTKEKRTFHAEKFAFKNVI